MKFQQLKTLLMLTGVCFIFSSCFIGEALIDAVDGDDPAATPASPTSSGGSSDPATCTATPTLLAGTMQGCPLNLVNAVTTFAGGSQGFVNGTGTGASFNTPIGMTTDGTNLYVTEYSNNAIRKIVIATGEVTTIAGNGSGGSNNATGTSASFRQPRDITTDGTNLYVADTGNHLIRKIVIATGVVTTLAGTGSIGSDNGTGTGASFYNPHGITTDGTNLYVGDYNNTIIRKIVISSGVVTTLAGTVGSAGFVNGTGTSASFKLPTGLTTDGTNLYVVDEGNFSIRKIVISSGVVTTVAGTGSSENIDDIGTNAGFITPEKITTDGTNLYVATRNSIRKIVIATGEVTTLAGSASEGFVNDTGTSARFGSPRGITTDGTNLYIVDQENHAIRKIE